MQNNGIYKINNIMYKFIYTSNEKEKTKIVLVLRNTPLNGKEPIKNLNDFKGNLDSDYILEGIHIKRTTGEKKTLGRNDISSKILELINRAESEPFTPKQIYIDEVKFNADNRVNRFSASSESFTSEYERDKNGNYFYLKASTFNASVNMALAKKTTRGLKKIVFDNVIYLDTKKLLTPKRFTRKDLDKIYDTSWLKGKDYGTIKSNYEFEKFVVRDIVDEYFKHIDKGETFRLALDVESTGLNFYNISKSNPLLDKITSVPLSWKPDQARVVFTRMDNFDNVDIGYLFDRLSPLLTKDVLKDSSDLKIKIKVLKKDVDEDDYLQAMGLLEKDDEEDTDLSKIDLFGDYEESEESYDIWEEIELDRNMIKLVGHNVMFDGRAIYSDVGLKTFWDEDTLQMSFNLNPTSMKSKKYSNKLKGITRRAFNHETPELTEILGKGYEACYHMLVDEEIATIYGCADADYTRKMAYFLRDLMSEEQYVNLYRLDMKMLNKLYLVEYDGMRYNVEGGKLLAEQTLSDIGVLMDFLRNYIGVKIDKNAKVNAINIDYHSGIIDEDEMVKRLSQMVIDKNAVYNFELKDTGKVLYDILKYPVLRMTDKGKPSTDKYVLDKLSEVVLTESSDVMKDDIVSKDGKRVLMSKELFNSLQYPVAKILRIISSLNKDYTSVYKPFAYDNIEEKVFKGFSLARIETRRIANPLQTVKKDAKKLLVPYDKDWYMTVFDMAQVEYRIMVSIAKDKFMIDRLLDPEKDFHTESAASLKGLEPHLVPKEIRKMMKSVHFAIPYGLGLTSLCINMFGHLSIENMRKTVELYTAFTGKYSEVMELLNSSRRQSHVPVELSKKFKDFNILYDDIVNEETGDVKRVYKEIGMVKNLLSNYRLFDLTDKSKSTKASIDRKAGNYPIQSFAAELFRIILIRFDERCKREGIADKVKWHMLVHDELVLSVHKSINPFYLYKMILEECMISFKGHTRYYVGINIGDSWYDGKDDLAEAPVLFVQEMVKRWDAGEFVNDKFIEDPKRYVDKYKQEFIGRRIFEVIKEIQPTFPEEPLDVKTVLENFSNYTVRAYLGDYYIPPRWTVNPKGWKKLNSSIQFIYMLSYCASKHLDYDFDFTLLGKTVNSNSIRFELNDEEKLLIENKEAPVASDFELFLDYDDEEFETEYLINTDKIDKILNSDYVEDDNYMRYYDYYDSSKNKTSKTYLYLLRDKIYINTNSMNDISKVKNALVKDLGNKGLPVYCKYNNKNNLIGFIDMSANDKNRIKILIEKVSGVLDIA